MEISIVAVEAQMARIGYTYSELQAAIGISRNGLYKIRKTGRCSTITAGAIANALLVDVCEILPYSEENSQYAILLHKHDRLEKDYELLGNHFDEFIEASMERDRISPADTTRYLRDMEMRGRELILKKISRRTKMTAASGQK